MRDGPEETASNKENTAEMQVKIAQILPNLRLQFVNKIPGTMYLFYGITRINNHFYKGIRKIFFCVSQCTPEIPAFRI